MGKKLSIVERMLKKSSNPYAAKVLDCVIYKTNNYYDTGNYMQNLQVSGKIRGGWPGGKIVELSGDSQTGKSFFVINSLLNFLRINEKNIVVLFETEGAIISEKLGKTLTEEENDRFMVQPVKYHEDLGKFTAEMIEMIKELKAEDPEINFFVCLDSLGMLTPRAVYENVLKGKDTKVMTEQALIKSYFNLIKLSFAEYDVAFLYTNHIYLNFMANSYGHVPEWKKKVTRGGQGIEYSPDIKLRLTQKDLREVDGVKANDMYVNKTTDTLNNITGVKVFVIPTKSREFAKNIAKIERKIRFKTGDDRYSGCFEFLDTHKLITRTKAGSKGTKIHIPEIDYEFFTNELKGISKEEFWNDTLLDYIEKKFIEFYALESQKDMELSDELSKEEVTVEETD